MLAETPSLAMGSRFYQDRESGLMLLQDGCTENASITQKLEATARGSRNGRLCLGQSERWKKGKKANAPRAQVRCRDHGCRRRLWLA